MKHLTQFQKDQEHLEYEIEAKKTGFRMTEPFKIVVEVSGPRLDVHPAFENGNPDVNEAELQTISALISRALEPFRNSRLDQGTIEKMKMSIVEQFGMYRIPFKGVEFRRVLSP